MKDSKKDFLGKKTKPDSNSLIYQDTPLSKIFSTNIPSSIPQKISNSFEEYDLQFMFDESFLSLFKDGDSIIDRKFDENEFFLFNENKKCNSIKNDSSINSYEDKENSITEIFECTNILTKLGTIFIRIDIFKKKKEEYQMIKEQWVL